MKTLTFEQFEEIYKPIFNPFTSYPNNENYFFETYGEEVNYIKKQHNNFIWTLVDCDNEEQYIIPGYHIVNRSFYLLTEIPWENENIEVNYNEMISVLDAKKACYDFSQQINVQLSLNEVSDFFSSNKEEVIENKITIGKAKYLAIDFIEKNINDNLTDEQEDLIHNYYNQLI